MTEVRVGRHAEFTRVVFELDRAAGYRIERHESAPGETELIVTLNASGSSQRVDTPKSLVEGVSIESRGPDAAVARIRLSGADLRLKEMILSSPPRIVLDVLSDKPARVAATPKPKAKPAPKPAASKPTAAKPAPKPVPVAKATPKPAPKPVPVAKAPARKAAPKPAPKPVAKTPAPAPRPVPVAKATPKPKAAPAPKVAPKPAPTPSPAVAKTAEPPKSVPGARTTGNDPGEPSGGSLVGRADEERQLASAERPGARAAGTPLVPSERSRTAAPSGSDRARADSRPAPPPARRSAQSDADSSFDPKTIGLAAAGLAFIGAAFLWMRRRRSDDSVEVEDFGFGDDEAGGDNPFAGVAETPESIAQDHDTEAAPASEEGASFGEGPTSFDVSEEKPDATPPTKQTALFDTPESEGAAMEATPEIGTQTNPIAPPMAGGAADDVMRLVREMERRVANLETRLDEAVDARERLERQVVAQTEELRVQRAAIARTQRAVRNLSRPEEDGPTEPAPRDPERTPGS